VSVLSLLVRELSISQGGGKCWAEAACATAHARGPEGLGESAS